MTTNRTPCREQGGVPPWKYARQFAAAEVERLSTVSKTKEPIRGVSSVVASKYMVALACSVVLRKGNKPPGVDGITPRNVQDSRTTFVSSLTNSLADETYRPDRLRRAGHGRRVHYIETVTDKVAATSMRISLEPVIEAQSHDGSFGWRTERSPRDAIELVRSTLPIVDYVVRCDVESCFASTGREQVIESLDLFNIRDAALRRRLEAQLAPGRCDGTGGGLYKGTVLAPLLANMVLTRIDRLFPEIPVYPAWRYNLVPGRKRRIYEYVEDSEQYLEPIEAHNWEQHLELAGTTAQVDPLPSMPVDLSSASSPRVLGEHCVPAPACVYIRYGDDIVVLLRGSREQADLVLRMLQHALARLNLSPSPKKTYVRGVDEGFDFLGVQIRLDGQDVDVRVSDGKVQSVAERVRGAIRRSRHQSEPELMAYLDKVLSGTLVYFRDVGADTSDVRLRIRALLTGSGTG